MDSWCVPVDISPNLPLVERPTSMILGQSGATGLLVATNCGWDEVVASKTEMVHPFPTKRRLLCVCFVVRIGEGSAGDDVTTASSKSTRFKRSSRSAVVMRIRMFFYFLLKQVYTIVEVCCISIITISAKKTVESIKISKYQQL